MNPAAVPDDLTLPPLREELRIEKGPPLASGSPSFVIYDPARHRYFQMGVRAVELLSHWAAGTAGRLRAAVFDARGRRVGDGELKALLAFLSNHELTVAPGSKLVITRVDEARKARGHPLVHLAKTYIFFRVPLVRPEGFLRATLPFVRPFFTRGFVWVSLAVAVLGLALVSQQTDVFLTYAERFVSLEGALAYIVAIAFVKALHELGHAYQAALRGVRVPTMGVAFMVMFPLLYTDVSDAWRTRERRAKLLIDAGGVMVELSLAAFATLLWVFLPDGEVRGAAFVVATASWVLSLLVNLNPFMRFDAYYFLADATGIQNLQPRSFALCRWHLRETLFGLGETAPERLLPATRRFMIVYGYLTWIYRLFLFIGIALIVYHLFFKALGILLFLVEIVFLVALPIVREMGVWWGKRRTIVRRRRAFLTGGVLSALIAFVVIPQPVVVHAPATLGFSAEADIFPPRPGQLAARHVTEGDQVAVGDVLYVVASPELEAEMAQAERRIALLERRIARRLADARDRAAGMMLMRELEAERETLAGLSAERARLSVTSPIAGVVVDVAPGLDEGRWLARRTRVARVVARGGVAARGVVTEADLPRIAAGDTGDFIADDPARPIVPVRLSAIAPFATAALVPPYAAAENGGPVRTLPRRGEEPVRPDGSWFEVRADVEGGAAPFQVTQVQRGTLRIVGRRESWASRALTQIARVLVREANA